MKIPSKELTVGSRGKLVTDLQRELKQAGFDPKAIDGDFGAHTKAAVEAFQRARHLTVDGVAGKETWTALGGDRFENAKSRGTTGAHHTHHTHHAHPPHHGSTGGAAGGAGEPWKAGAGQLAGADTSGWQSNAEFESSIAGRKWTALKATEGTNWTDPTFASRWRILGDKIASGQMKLRVAYLFMHAGNGAAQARHFLDALGVHGKLQPGTRLALDWEASSLNDPGALRDAANEIHRVTGLWPLIYTSASEVSRAKAAVPEAPIWEAKWSGPVPKDVPFVQTADGPVYDHDVFNGDLAALEKFAGWKA